jgi:dTDP-4-dehydrorhamnose reductase
MLPKLLITGGSGLLALNWAVAVRGRFSVILGSHHREVMLDDVKTTRINLESATAFEKDIALIQPDVVVHTVALTSVEQCELDPIAAKHVNVALAEIVAKACAKRQISLVHISTDHLFSGTKALVDELEPVSPVNNYGCTKAEAEIVVQHSHVGALIIRTNFYGWGTNYRQSFSDTIISTLKAGKELILFEDVFYTPILIESLVFVVHELLKRGATGVFNVVSNERISKFDFGMKVAEVFCLNQALIKAGSISSNQALVARPSDMSLSNEKVVKMLGIQLNSVHDDILRLSKQNKLILKSDL